MERRSFREWLAQMAHRASWGTPREAMHLACAAGLAFIAGEYTSAAALSQVGLGAVGSLCGSWLERFWRGGKEPPPRDVVQAVLADEEACGRLFGFLRENDLLWQEIPRFSEEAQQQFSELLLAGLQECDVATKEDVRSVKLLAERIEAGVGRIERKVDDILRKPKVVLREEPVARFAVPFDSKGDEFVGRSVDLERLGEILAPGQPVGVIAPRAKPAGVTGQGGIGKTQLAVEYAWRCAGRYPGGVFWMNAAADLVEGMADCADRAGFCEGRPDLSDLDVKRDLASALYRWLQAHPDSLLILDNIDDPVKINAPLLRNLCLRELGCRIAFTTRSRAFDERQFRSWEVKILPREAAVDLLLGSRRSEVEQDEEELRAARGICAMLGDLALALEQAGAYLQHYPTVKVSDYRRRLLCEGAIETADDTPLTAEELSTRHDIGLNAVLQDSIKHLDPEGRAVKALRVLAEFGENEIVPRHRVGLAAGLSHEAQGGRVDELSVALEELASVSLVEVFEGGELRLHPLVREFALGLSRGLERSSWLESIAGEFAVGLMDLARAELELGDADQRQAREELAASPGFLRSPGASEGSTMSFVRELQWAMRVLPTDYPKGSRCTNATLLVQEAVNSGLDTGCEELRGYARGLLHETRGSHHLLHRRPGRSGHPYLFGIGKAWSECPTGLLAAAFSPGGNILAAGCDDRSIRVWDLESDELIARLTGPAAWSWGLAFSADGNLLASGSDDHTVRVWALETSEEVARLEGHTGWVWGVAFSGAGDALASAGEDGTIRVWDFVTGRELDRIDEASTVFTSVCFSPRGDRIAAGQRFGEVLIWDLGGNTRGEPGRNTSHLRGKYAARALALSPDGGLVACGSWSHSVAICSTTELSLLARYPTCWGIAAVWWSADGERVKAAEMACSTWRPYVYELEFVQIP